LSITWAQYKQDSLLNIFKYFIWVVF
jgi:hypothetical protein